VLLCAGHLQVRYFNSGSLILLAKQKKITLGNRFRGLLPIVIDVETSGLNPETDALLELAAVSVGMTHDGKIFPDQVFAFHVEAFEGARIDPESLAITGIDPGYPLRYAIPEQQDLRRLFAKIRQLLEISQCRRAVLVGHNAWFDLHFIQAAVKRCHIKSVPLHSFTSFDTASLSALALGETVLAKAIRRAGIEFDINQAHSAIYDAQKTAELFCHITNQFSSR
jgi:ribonuclease T